MKQVNTVIFGGRIESIDNIKIIWREKPIGSSKIRAYAWYYPAKNVLYLFRKEHRDVNELFATLCHELIHVYQKECGFDHYSLNHGGKFFRYFADKICKVYDINRKGF